MCIIRYLSMAMVQGQSYHLHHAYQRKKNELALKRHASLLDAIRSSTNESSPIAFYLNQPRLDLLLIALPIGFTLLFPFRQISITNIASDYTLIYIRYVRFMDSMGKEGRREEEKAARGTGRPLLYPAESSR